MTLLVLLFVLIFVVLVVCGVRVHAYLYANGAFGEKIRRRSKLRFSMVSLGQTATMPTAAAAADLYSGMREGKSAYTHTFILYSLGILLMLVVLILLVLGATQF